MPKLLKDLVATLAPPPIRALTRIEPSLTESSLEPGFAARIADPAWLLARQVQFGELRGEDAATPVRVELTVDLSPIDGPAPRGAPDTPLEPGVEAQDVTADTAPGRRRLAAELGLGVRRALLAVTAESVWATLQAALPLAAAVDDDPGQRLLARRSLDGLALARRLADTPLDVATLAQITGLPASGLQSAVAALLDWHAQAAAWSVSPPASDPWDAGRFEHRFALRSADRKIELPAAEYPGGHLDWYSFDIAAPATATGAATLRHSAIPLPIQFPGMPAARWWDLEDEAVNLTDLEAGPEDMIRMLAAELMTAFADDWYLVPIRLPLGHLARVASLVVDDTFSYKRTPPVPIASFAQQDGPARTWRMFELSGQAQLAHADETPGPGPWMFLAPTIADPQESEPIEEVRLLRDEDSNLGWAVERTLEGPDGRPRRHAEPRSEPAPPRGDAGWAWQLASAVPRGWIPLAPVPTGDGTNMALRRARLPHWAPDEGACAQLLDPLRKLVVPEEELPAGGIIVTRTWQRARGPAGEVLLWQGREKRPGSGEPSAELLFDRLKR